MENLMDEEPLLRTSTGSEGIQSKSSIRKFPICKYSGRWVTSGPAPVAHFRHIFAIFRDVKFMALNGLRVPLLGGADLRSKTRDAMDGVQRELEAVNVVQHAHVEWSRGGAFFLVAANVQGVVVVAAVGEAVNEPGITVKVEDGGHTGRKDLVVLLVGQA